MYLIIWEYVVSQEKVKEFKHEYGLKGSWQNFFSASASYQGSYLYKSDKQPDTYLLIDKWLDRQSYEDFKEDNNNKYMAGPQ